MTDERRLEVPSVGIARCLGSGSYEDGKFYWREGCDDCQRRYVRAGDGWAGSWIDPPPIIAFECEYRIGPDEIVALEALPMTDQPCLEVPFDEVEKWEKIEGSCARLYAAAEWGYKKGLKEQRSTAFRELADQVVPHEKAPVLMSGPDLERLAQRQHTRAQILAIATELEN